MQTNILFASCATAFLTTWGATRKNFWLSLRGNTATHRLDQPMMLIISLLAAGFGFWLGTLTKDPAAACFLAATAAMLGCLAYTDAKTRELGDTISVVLAIVALCRAALLPAPTPTFVSALLGGATALAVIWILTKAMAPFTKGKTIEEKNLDAKLSNWGVKSPNPNESCSWKDADPRMHVTIPNAILTDTNTGVEIPLSYATLTYRKLTWTGQGTDQPTTIELDQAGQEYRLVGPTYITTIPNMGMGDFWLLPSLGACLGLNQYLLGMFILSALLGVAHGLINKVRRGNPLLPYGTYLAIGTLYELAAQYGAVPSIPAILQKLTS